MITPWDEPDDDEPDDDDEEEGPAICEWCGRLAPYFCKCDPED